MATNDDLKQAELEKNLAEAERYRQEAEVARLKAADLDYQKGLRDASEFENRIYNFGGSVSGKSVEACIGEIGMWVRQTPAKPIKIIFNSPGGSVFEGLALFDFIREVRQNGTRIDTLALGMAASMGGVLLQAGEKRIMSPHAYMLCHEVSTGAIGSLSELEDEVTFSKRLQDRLLDILAERSKLTKRQISRKWKRKDWWMSAQEALEFGFVDSVE